jgi:hypothetical protein
MVTQLIKRITQRKDLIMIKELGEFAKGFVDVAKDYSIPGKLAQAVSNYVQRVADRWVSEDPKTLATGETSVVKQLGNIMKEEGGRLGKETLLALMPIGPKIKND